jgi:hypothetical protein
MRKTMIPTVLFIAALVMTISTTPAMAKEDLPGKGAEVFAGYHLATSVLGVKVINISGEEVGEIEDLIINDAAKVEFAVVETGAILDLGGKLVPVPWKVFLPGMTKNNVTLKMSKDVIKNAPNFKVTDWPKINTKEWRSSVMDYYKKNIGK